MEQEYGSHASGPSAMFLDGDAVAPHPELAALAVDRPFRWRDLSENLSQFQPRALLCGQEGDASLLGVVSHEDGHKQCQHENSSEQIEDDEEKSICQRSEGLRLLTGTCHAHCTPLHICPAFLGNNLEQNEERTAEIVEAIVRIRGDSWCQNIPIIWRAHVLADTVVQAALFQIAIIAFYHLPIEEVEPVDSKRNKETHGDKGRLDGR